MQTAEAKQLPSPKLGEQHTEFTVAVCPGSTCKYVRMHEEEVAKGTNAVRVCIFLLSGLFCCLSFWVVIFAVWAKHVFFFCCLGGGAGPAQTANKKKTPPKISKIQKPQPLPVVFFVAVWAMGVFIFVLFGPVACFFCCLGRGRVCFCCLGRVVLFAVSVWAGGVFIFLLFGPVFFFLLAVWAGGVFCLLFGPFFFFFFAVWAEVVFFLLFERMLLFLRNGSSLTFRSAWLVFKRPNSKKDQTATKNKTRVPHECMRQTDKLKQPVALTCF